MGHTQTREQPRAPVPLIVPVVLVMASAISIFSTDLFTPSLPHLTGYFGTTAATVQLTMSLNLAAFALAQLVHGPLADRFGRRVLILWGMITFIGASVGCALSTSIDMLIAFRVLQGLTISAEAVVVMVVIRDLWDEVSGAKVLAAYGMAIAMAPAAGPVIGGYMHVGLGWQSNFWLLVGLAILATAALWRYLPETGTPDRYALRFGRVFHGYKALLGYRLFMGYALVASLVMGGLFAFITEAPFLLIVRHGVATEHFGYFQAVVVFAYFLGSLFANRAVARIGIEMVLRLGLAVQSVGATAFLAVLWLGFETPYTIIAVVSIYLFGLGLIFSTGPIRALSVAATGLRTAAGGSAAALLGAGEMGVSAVGAFAVGTMHDGTGWPTALVLSTATALAVIVYVLLCRGAVPTATAKAG